MPTIESNAMTKACVDLPIRQVDKAILPIDRTIEKLFKEKLDVDRQAAASAFREREERL